MLGHSAECSPSSCSARSVLKQKGEGVRPSLGTCGLLGADWEIPLLMGPNACEVYTFLTALQSGQ